MIFTTLKKTLVLAIAIMAGISAYAVPAKRVWRTVTLTDGTQIEAMLVGDEHGHWLVDRNGKALAKNDDGKAYYMTATEFSERKEIRSQRAAKSNAMRVQKITKTRALSAQATSNGARKTFGQPTTIIGKKKGLVILVNFSDKSFNSANNQALFNRRFNEVGYNDKGYIGSVHDYFYDQSYGKFDLEFDVVGPVTVSKAHDYYGANDKDDNDKYPATMVIEALKLADAQGVDFSKYDWDGDGEVDQVFVIYAGTGEAVSNKENDIWPHEYSLSEAKQTGDGSGKQYIDGKYINTYACSCEMATSTTIDGIGTACHEFSHCLGYADLYDIDYSGGQGMMYWDLLDGGSYNGPESNGEVPAAYTSFERWWAGWMEPVVLSKPQNVKDMPALNDTAVAYKIINDAHPDEYYLLENRQAKRWDSYTAGNGNGTGHGMLILHVDYDKEVWENNGPNDDPSRQRMTYFPADNSYGSKVIQDGQHYWSAGYPESAGDPFPGTSKNTSFSDSSAPAATLYNANGEGKKYMSKPITEIAETNGLISFTFMGGKETPETQSAVATSSSSFTATWKSVEDATSYTLRAMPYKERSVSESLVLSETFSKVSGSSNSDISSKLNDNFDNNGWSGSKIYPTGTGGVKVSSSSTNGYLLSPKIASTSGYLTVVINAKKYGSDKASLQTWLSNIFGTRQQAVDDYTLPEKNSDHVFSFTSNDSQRLSFMFTKRANVYSIKVYDGQFTAEQISKASATKQLAPLYVSTKVSGDTIYVEGVTDTNYTFTGLTASQYMFQAKAVFADGSESSWSTPTSVSLDATAINDVIADTIASDKRIYNISGQMVGTNFSTLPKGIYIIGGRKVIKR